MIMKKRIAAVNVFERGQLTTIRGNSPAVAFRVGSFSRTGERLRSADLTSSVRRPFKAPLAACAL
jgi:hypothetical protein